MSERSITTNFAILLLALLVPITAFAAEDTVEGGGGGGGEQLPSPTGEPYKFQNEGIFGCNQIAGVNGSAGTMAAIGGIFVPVNDAAVTLNTGIEEYHQCILRPLQDRLRESATSAFLKKMVTGVLTGREGNPQYVVDRTLERVQNLDKAALTFYTDGSLNSLNPAFRNLVRTTLARRYQRDTRAPDSELNCPIQGDLKGMLTDPLNNWNGFADFEMQGDPDCTPFYAALNAQDMQDTRLALADYNLTTAWAAGRDFYPRTDNAQDPLRQKTLTPASVVQESFQQVLGSPMRQLESANDIGQMIGALFSGVTTQVTTDSRGLAGITQSFGGQPSYLDQVAKESSQGVIGAAVNAALNVLNASRQVEGAYLASMNAIATSLTNAIQQLRATETQCWALIVPKVRDYAAQQYCTGDPPVCTGGFQLDARKISAATSSKAFSQQVIESQITPLGNVALQNVQSSQKALSLIDQLIAGVTNTASLDAQRIALQQLDNLVAQKLLHTQYDASNAAQQQRDISGSMQNLIQDTAKAWGDSTDPSVGWCNINNQGVIQMWADKWKK